MLDAIHTPEELGPDQTYVTFDLISNEYGVANKQLIIVAGFFDDAGRLGVEAVKYCIDNEPWKPVGTDDLSELCKSVVADQIDDAELQRKQLDEPFFAAMVTPWEYMTRAEYQEMVL